MTLPGHRTLLPRLLPVALVAACAGAPPASPTTTPGPEAEATTQPSAEPTEAPADIPDIEQFMRIRSASSPHRTADGAVFYQTWLTGVDQLYRIPPSGAEAEPLTDLEDGIERYQVSPDGAHVIVRASVGGSEQGDLYHLDPAGGALRPLYVDPEVRYDNVSWLPDSSGFLFRSNAENRVDFFIYRHDLGAEGATLVAETPGFNWITDVADDGQGALVVRYHSNVDSDVYALDWSAEGPTALSHLTPHAGEVEYFSPYWDATGRVLVATNRGASMRGIAVLAGEPGEVSYLIREDWEVEWMALDDDRRTLAYVINEGGYGRVHLMDVVTGEPLPGPDLPDGIARLAQFEHGHLLLTFSSAVRTADVWEHRLADGRTRQVTFSDYAGVDPSLFSEPRLIRYESFDGLMIPAFLYLPPGYSGGVVPTIIHVHGGPEAQFRPSFNRHFQYLALNGFAVLAPNIRGSSGYGPEYLALDDYRRRLDAIRDLGAAADWLFAEGISEPSRLGIKGASYGGYATMAAITEMPERFAAASNEVGIVNFVTFLENTAEYRRALREAEYGPLSDREFLASISPIHKVDRIQAPLLVIHGRNDSRVPVGEALQIVEALEARDHPVQTLIFENEGHGVRHLDNRLVMYRTMVDFFRQHLAE